MSAPQLVQYVTQLLYVAVFVAAVMNAARRPRRANLDIALFFGDTALVIAIGQFAPTPGGQQRLVTDLLSPALLLALPYLLLRLVDDFAGVPLVVRRLAEVGLALALVSLLVYPASSLPVWISLLLVIYFVAFELYAAILFAREAGRSTGVSRRRLQAIAAGSVFLGLTILVAGLQVAEPALAGIVAIASGLLGLASGIAYVVGFAPPALLRRAWQTPELRAFLVRASTLTQLPDLEAIRPELEKGAAAALGVPTAFIGLWDESAGVLHFWRDGERIDVAPGQFIAGIVFERQTARFSTNLARDDPAHGELYDERRVVAILAAPITAGSQPLGVLVVNARRAPLFAEDDLSLIQLLASQAAIVLENRRLIDELARTRAREEATRLRDDFLSAAAHDLKTPLTTLIAQAQLLERRAQFDPHAPADPVGITRMVTESKRLNLLVLRLLDVSRMEGDGEDAREREAVDLAVLVREACERSPSPLHPFEVEAREPVIVELDRARVAQLLDNLVGNAIKFSPSGGTVRFRVWRDDGVGRLTITDRGIGIPSDDLPHVFDRFFRGSNVDDRRFAGMGLGLYIARQIVEQHGGRIWATSAPGHDTTIQVSLPLELEEH